MMDTTKLRRFLRNVQQTPEGVSTRSRWVGYTNCHNSWVEEEDLHTSRLLEQFQASRSSATTGGVQNTVEGVLAGRGK